MIGIRQIGIVRKQKRPRERIMQSLLLIADDWLAEKSWPIVVSAPSAR